MAKCYPETIPSWCNGDDELTNAYKRGWNHGHGIACHNVPNLGTEYWTENMGRVTANPENIRDIHEDMCFQAESNSRQFSPFEFTAHEFNNQDDEFRSDDLWDAFGEGTNDAIAADLAEYTDEDYGIAVCEC